MASTIKNEMRSAIEEDVFAEISSACLRKIQLRVTMTVRKVTIETIRVAVKNESFESKGCKQYEFFKKKHVFLLKMSGKILNELQLAK